MSSKRQAASSLDGFHPAVAAWFRGRFARPTEAQELGWAEIAAGADTLIMAPTGSGKTLAAFLAGVDGLVRRAAAGALDDQVRILYISPLKALGVDIGRNLDAPLQGIALEAPRFGLLPPPIRTAVRSGDTTAVERARMIRHPPHIVITTPESLYLLLTSAGGRAILGGVETVIVDEIHALYGQKRGAHLTLSLERLDALTGRRPLRIGLSATASPPEEVARFLVGCDPAGGARPCRLVDSNRVQPLDVAVEVPKEPLSAVASRKAWGDVYERLAELVRAHRTTLIFVPSRRLAERVAHDLEEPLGKGAVAAHHGALAKRTRQSIERRLVSGELKAVVATASLELGIDIGAVELVCQISSPRSLSVLRQRIGRADHAVGGTPKGRIFALTRDDLLECGAAVRAIRAGMLDRPVARAGPLDVLAQQLVAECASREWELDALYALCRRAAPYAALPRAEFDDVLTMLADGVSTRRGRSGAHLHFDRIGGRVRGRRGARLAALTSGGAIPDKADYQVVEDPSGAVVGTLDEDFAIESMAGDIFLLGSTSWRVRRVLSGRVHVEDAHGLPPSVPFWNGEGLARTAELSSEVSRLREELLARSSSGSDAAEWLMRECALVRAGAEQAVAYVVEGARALGAIPTCERLIAERFFDDSGGMQLVVHAPLGARLNRAWGLALRKRFCTSFDFELQAAATDDGILLSLGPQHSFPLEAVFGFLHPRSVRQTLTQAMLQTPLWETRWRWNATRALAVLRATGGRRTPPYLIRMRAADLLAAVFPAQVGCQDNHGTEPLAVPAHPLCLETLRDCLEEAADIDGLERLLEQIGGGEIVCLARDTVAPSPFSHALLNANPYAFLDDAPLEERRTRAVATLRAGEADLDLAQLDPAAIEAVAAEVAASPRDADELHDHLMTAVVVAPRPEWAGWFDELERAGRATRLERAGAQMWLAMERAELVAAAFPDGVVAGVPLARAETDAASALAAVLGGRIENAGPVTASELGAELGVPRGRIDAALVALEADGRVMRGRFRGLGDELEWCERRLLQRIHRRTLSRLREQIRPVTPAELIRFLLRWQHLHPGTQLHGREGVARVIDQLEGLELRPAAWERDVLGQRVADYSPAWLDELCLSGEVAWGRLRMAPPEETERGRPRGAASAIGLFRRGDASWLIDRGTGESPSGWRHLDPLACSVAAELERRGASFLAELCAVLGQPKARLEDALWELVRTGAASSDAFTGLRALLGQSSRGRAAAGRVRHDAGAAGRWSLLHRDSPLRAPDAGPFGDGSPVEHARLYLRRYGVVVRELLARETVAPPWRELVLVYRRLEARGEVRGGRLVAGLSGEQFALPEALDALRALAGRKHDPEEVTVAATDPLNLVGILTPGPRLPAVLGHSVLYRDGVPISQLRAIG